MHKIVSWITSLLFIPLFIGTLIIFHPILVVANLIGGRALLYQFVLAMDWTLITLLRICGVSYKVSISEAIPQNAPLMFISNHQSMFDIPIIMWFLRRYKPTFIAKKELAKWIPSISFTIRHSGCVVIDRGDAKQALSAIDSYAKSVECSDYSGCIFPEGTRARDGKIKRFKVGGVAAIMRASPTLPIVPVAISRSWEIVRNGLLPVPFGVKVTLTVLEPLSSNNRSAEDLNSEAQARISATLQGNT